MQPCSDSGFGCTVMPGTKLQEHTGSERAWVYSTYDFADETQKMELFCLRFASVESAPLSHPSVLSLPHLAILSSTCLMANIGDGHLSHLSIGRKAATPVKAS
jgi:RanBP1 domain